MKDDLKKYLNDNRQDFENEIPSDNLWSKINEDLRPEKKKKDNFFNWRIAASVAVVLGIGAMFLSKQSPVDEGAKSEMAETINTEINNLSHVSADLEEVESYYTIQVNNKMNQLQAFDIDEDLVLEMDELKIEFEELKKEMGVGADQSIIVEAMINNYRLRLMLLEDLLQAVGDTKQTNTINYERDI